MGAGIAAARLGFESLVQREVPPPARGTAITRAETTFQLAWVAGAVLPVAFPLPTTPSLLAAAVVCLVAATTYTVGLLRLRRRRAPQPSLRRLVGEAVEQPAQPGMELAVGGGAGELAGQRPHLGEAVPGEAGEGRLGTCRVRGIGVALHPRRLEGGEPEGVDQQDPERLDRPLALQAAPPQQLEADLAEPGRVGPQPRAAEEHGRQPGVGQQQPAGGVHHPDQPVPPVALGRIAAVDAAEQVVDQVVEQPFLVRDVGVEGVGRHPQLGGQAAHGEALHPLLVGDPAGRLQHRRAGQAGPLAGAAGSRSRGG